jgi:hypothetical protein
MADPCTNPTGINEIFLRALQDSLAAGWISRAEFIAAVAAIAGQPVRTPIDGYNLSRTKSAVAAATPAFRGDPTDSTTAGRWVDAFEHMATNHALDRTEWAMQAVLSFPPNSAGALWADSVFCPGLRFQCK